MSDEWLPTVVADKKGKTHILAPGWGNGVLCGKITLDWTVVGPDQYGIMKVDCARCFGYWAETKQETTFEVELADLRWTIHDLDWNHIFPHPEMGVTEGEIVVERMNDGRWFVEDGRHRAIRAMLRGDKTIRARVKDHAADRNNKL